MLWFGKAKHKELNSPAQRLCILRLGWIEHKGSFQSAPSTQQQTTSPLNSWWRVSTRDDLSLTTLTFSCYQSASLGSEQASSLPTSSSNSTVFLCLSLAFNELQLNSSLRIRVKLKRGRTILFLKIHFISSSLKVSSYLVCYFVPHRLEGVFACGKPIATQRGGHPLEGKASIKSFSGWHQHVGKKYSFVLKIPLFIFRSDIIFISYTDTLTHCVFLFFMPFIALNIKLYSSFTLPIIVINFL